MVESAHSCTGLTIDLNADLGGSQMSRSTGLKEHSLLHQWHPNGASGQAQSGHDIQAREPCAMVTPWYSVLGQT